MMEHRQTITPQDWRKVAELLGDAATTETLADMIELVVRRVHDLFSAELVIWDRFDQQVRQLAFHMYPAATDDLIRRTHAPFLATWHQHPYQPKWVEEIGSGRVGLLSDRISNREFRRTALWNEAYIHLRGKHQILFGGPMDSDSYWNLALNRLGSDYSPRDRELCRFLQPRLTRLFQRHAQCKNAVRMAEILRHPNSAVLIIDRGGQVCEMSEKAHELLAGAGDYRSSLTALAANSGRRSTAITSTPIHGITAITYRPADEGPAIVMLDSKSAASGPRKLTRREAEVFHWISEGKTNAEIGAVLQISARTVAKHCEQIFAKLGVENRIGAALAARQFR